MAAADGPPRSSLELAIAERNAQGLGVSVGTLMDNAGRAIAEELVAHFPDPAARIVVVAGAGNNGGDGATLVHHLLAGGRSPELWIVPGRAAIRSEPARLALASVEGRLKVRDGPPTPSDLAGAAVAVDALLGTGQSGALRGPYREAVATLRGAKVPILAVDLPTGFGGPDTLVPTWTVTLSTPKIGLSSTNGGEVTVRAIGLPDAAFDRTGPGEYLAYPRTKARGRNARLAVIGGGPYSGAPALAGLAALRAGAERVTLYVPEPAAGSIRAYSPDLVVVSSGRERLRPEDVPAILTGIREAKLPAVVMGMGLGRHSETREAAKMLLAALAGTTALVVDADALDSLPTTIPSTPASPVVVTPNVGEFSRIFAADATGSREARIGSAQAVSKARGITVVAKGSEDVLASGQRTATSGPHPPAMNVGGSGDVLAGVIGRLLAEDVDPFLAARLGTQWMGETGLLVASRLGDGLLATDLIEHLPLALQAGLRAARLG
jgi:ADP-dependent NAD(P)H-hydrate dehydratase / NAD(P)H-hydrate epimerase